MSRFTRKRRFRGGGSYQGYTPVAFDAQVVAPITQNGAAPLQNGNPYPNGGGLRLKKSLRRKKKKRVRFMF
jgi:hypothetical protein